MNDTINAIKITHNAKENIDGYSSYIAMYKESIVGILEYKKNAVFKGRYCTHIGRCENYTLSKEYPKKISGIGSTLLFYAIQDFSTGGCNRIRIETTKHSHGFYETFIAKHPGLTMKKTGIEIENYTQYEIIIKKQFIYQSNSPTIAPKTSFFDFLAGWYKR